MVAYVDMWSKNSNHCRIAMENKNDTVDVSVIIVSWNTNEILKNCLKSIYQETQRVSFEVIVIDNDSVDGTPDMINKEFSEVILIANNENRGFAAANNQGLKIAHGRYSLLLNPDTVILENAIDKMIPIADKRPEYAVLGCKVYENKDVVQMTGFAFPCFTITLYNLTGLKRLFPKSRIFGKEKMFWWDRNSEREIDVISGMFMLVRKEAIDEIGLMDEDYFVYAEEADWCYRFWKEGWGCFFTPAAKIIHLDGGGKSTAQVSVKMFVQIQKSLLVFHRKNLGWFSWIATKNIFIIAMILRLLVFKILSFLKVGENSRHKSRQAFSALLFHILGKEPVG